MPRVERSGEKGKQLESRSPIEQKLSRAVGYREKREHSIVLCYIKS